MKIAGIAVFVCAALAQTAQTPSEPKPAVVEGKVVNSVTGESIRKADLTLTTSLMPEGFDAMVKQFGLDADVMDDMPAAKGPKKTFTATTDAAGKFQFEKVDPAITTSPPSMPASWMRLTSPRARTLCKAACTFPPAGS